MDNTTQEVEDFLRTHNIPFFPRYHKEKKLFLILN